MKIVKITGGYRINQSYKSIGPRTLSTLMSEGLCLCLENSLLEIFEKLEHLLRNKNLEKKD